MALLEQSFPTLTVHKFLEVLVIAIKHYNDNPGPEALSKAINVFVVRTFGFGA